MFEQCCRELRLAVRGLRRARGFTAAAVLTLAVGLAGTTVMFALVEGVLLRPLPVRQQDRLLVAWKAMPSAGLVHYPFRSSMIDRLRGQSQLLEAVAGVGYNGASPTRAVENGTAAYISTAPVTGAFFEVTGIGPLLGRALNRADDVIGAEHVLVITSGLWRRRYGGSPDVIGRRMTIGERPFTIVGVMPPDFQYPRGVEAWVTLEASASTLTNAAFIEGVRRDVDLIARLRPGATREQAAAELQALTSRLEADAPADAPRGLTTVVRSYEEVVVGDVRPAMLVLFAAVALVLLIASANVANLLLMRGEGRRQELAVRAALGAGRGRLARQLLVESVVLALGGGLLGLAASWWTLRVALPLVPYGLPRAESVRIDTGVVVFAIGVVFLAAALAGVAPALFATHVDLASQLRSGGRGAAGGGSRRGRRALVIAQVALAITIVAAAGLLIRSLLRLQSVDMGLAADRLVFVELDLPGAKYADRARHLQFLNEVVAQLEAAPGIAGATPVNTAPFAGTGGWDLPAYTAEGQSAEGAAANPSLNLESIHPNYFDTFGVAVVRGRAFTAADRQGAPAAAIVSEDVAARTWPGGDAIGERIKFGGVGSTEPWWTIVGVARRTRYRELAEPRATLYVPAEQFIVAAQMLVVRTARPLALVAALARDRVRAVDPAVQVMRVAPFAALLDAPLARPRFNAVLIGVFAAAALLLATVGLYAVMGAHVRQRYPEIGIRVALGATASDVRRLVIGEGLRLAALGIGIGLVAASVTTQLLRGLLFGVHPLDPPALAAAALLLTAASALACYLPARRAARVDPVTWLRR